jgi:hypothetical protein
VTDRMTLVEALATMLGVRGGGEAVVTWLQRLPGAGVEPARRKLFGSPVPEAVTLGKWRLSPTDDGLLLQLFSGDIAVRTRDERGMAAAALVADVVSQHTANLVPAHREQVAVEVGALCEAVAAGQL